MPAIRASPLKWICALGVVRLATAPPVGSRNAPTASSSMAATLATVKMLCTMPPKRGKIGAGAARGQQKCPARRQQHGCHFSHREDVLHNAAEAHADIVDPR